MVPSSGSSRLTRSGSGAGFAQGASLREEGNWVDIARDPRSVLPTRECGSERQGRADFSSWSKAAISHCTGRSAFRWHGLDASFAVRWSVFLTRSPLSESFRRDIPTRRSSVAKFLVKASYTAEGAKGVQSAGGTSRRDAVAKMAEGLGGSLEASTLRSARPMPTWCWTCLTTEAQRRRRSPSTPPGERPRKSWCC